jgi:endonuclease YncB( thermonuclease family)
VPVERFLKHLTRRRWAVSLMVVGALAALSWADHRGFFLYDGGDWSAYQGRSFRVVRVLDGDTIEIDRPDGDHAATRVRLWGVDAPEVAHHPGAGAGAGATVSEPMGNESAAFVRRECEGKMVGLELVENHPRDAYHRLLAYVVLADGSVLNERLLAAGLARDEKRFPHQQLERYELLQQQARFDKIGLWAGGRPAATPASRPAEVGLEPADPAVAPDP